MIDPFAGFDRAAGIGGSDMAAIMGLSPWRDILDVWMEKTRHPMWTPKRVSSAMEWGTILEPVIRDAYTAKTGRTVYTGLFPTTGGLEVQEHDGQFAYWHWNGIQFAHLDGWLNEQTIWEAKTASNAEYWADGVPESYQIQAQQYMDIVGAARCVFAVLFSGRDFRVYSLDADPVLQGQIQDKAERFWADVVQKRPPVPDLPVELLYPVSSSDFPVQQWPARTPDIDLLLNIRADIAEMQRAEVAVVDRIKAAIGDAPGVVGPGFRIDYRSNRPPRTVGWEQVAAGLERTLEMVRRFRAHLPPEAAPHLDPSIYDTLVSLYTVTGRAARPFVIKEDTNAKT